MDGILGLMLLASEKAKTTLKYIFLENIKINMLCNACFLEMQTQHAGLGRFW